MDERKLNTGYSASFCQRLQAIMKSTGARQEDVAHAAGVKRQTVGYWCNGKTVPDAVALGNIAHYFGVTSDYLLGLSDCPAVEEDAQAACAYTGLSSEACFALHALKTMQGAEPALKDLHDVLSFLLAPKENLLISFAMNVLEYKHMAKSYLDSLGKNLDAALLYKNQSALKGLRYSAVEQATECADRYVDSCLASDLSTFNQEHPDLAVTLKKGTFEVKENPGQ